MDPAGRGGTTVPDAAKIIDPLLGAVGKLIKRGKSLGKIRDAGRNVVNHPVAEGTAGRVRVQAKESERFGFRRGIGPC